MWNSLPDESQTSIIFGVIILIILGIIIMKNIKFNLNEKPLLVKNNIDDYKGYLKQFGVLEATGDLDIVNSDDLPKIGKIAVKCFRLYKIFFTMLCIYLLIMLMKILLEVIIEEENFFLIVWVSIPLIFIWSLSRVLLDLLFDKSEMIYRTLLTPATISVEFLNPKIRPLTFNLSDIEITSKRGSNLIIRKGNSKYLFYINITDTEEDKLDYLSFLTLASLLKDKRIEDDFTSDDIRNTMKSLKG